VGDGGVNRRDREMAFRLGRCARSASDSLPLNPANVQAVVQGGQRMQTALRGLAFVLDSLAYGDPVLAEDVETIEDALGIGRAEISRV
jgi:hypothetical protein